MLLAVSTTAFPLLVIIAAVGDVLSRRIPNLLVLVIAVLFLPVAWAEGLSASGILMNLAAGLVLLTGGFAAFCFGYLGGGDAKLLGAAGLWLGFPALPQFLMMTALAGGILGLAVLAWSFIMFEAEFRGTSQLRRLSWVRPSVPYGFAIAAGTILSLPESWLPSGAVSATWLTQI